MIFPDWTALVVGENDILIVIDDEVSSVPVSGTAVKEEFVDTTESI